MSRKLISVLGATVLSLAALPWTAQSAPATAKAIGNRLPVLVAGSLQASGRQASELGGISPEVLSLALRAVQCGVASGDLHAPPTLTVIDYSRPSVEPRLWVYDLKTGKLLFKELVAHGRNTGENMATQFSDAMNSHQSSLGLFVTSDTYVGNNGYSLRLDGLEPGVNARARERAIVMHGAPYVDAKLADIAGPAWPQLGLPRAARGGGARRHQYDPRRRRDLFVLSRRALAQDVALPERLRRARLRRPRHLVSRQYCRNVRLNRPSTPRAGGAVPGMMRDTP